MGSREPLQGTRTEEVEFISHRQSSQKKFSSFRGRHNHSCAPQRTQILFHGAQKRDQLLLLSSSAQLSWDSSPCPKCPNTQQSPKYLRAADRQWEKQLQH